MDDSNDDEFANSVSKSCLVLSFMAALVVDVDVVDVDPPTPPMNNDDAPPPVTLELLLLVLLLVVENEEVEGDIIMNGDVCGCC